MVRKFKVLYTHQILKKRKVWQDGLLTLSLDEKHGILYDDEKKRLSTVYLRKTEVNSGDDLECDKYLIQVEEESSDGAISNQSTQYSQSQTLVPTFSSNLSIGKFCSQSADVSRTKVLKQFHIPRRKEVLPTSVPEQSKAISCRFSKEIEPVENTASSIWTNVLNDTKERSGVQLAATKPNIVSSPPSLRSTEDLLLFLNNGKVQNSATSQTAVKRRKFVHDLELNHKIPALSEAKEKSTSLIDEKLEPLVTESNEFHLLSPGRSLEESKTRKIKIIESEKRSLHIIESLSEKKLLNDMREFRGADEANLIFPEQTSCLSDMQHEESKETRHCVSDNEERYYMLDVVACLEYLISETEHLVTNCTNDEILVTGKHAIDKTDKMQNTDGVKILPENSSLKSSAEKQEIPLCKEFTCQPTLHGSISCGGHSLGDIFHVPNTIRSEQCASTSILGSSSLNNDAAPTESSDISGNACIQEHGDNAVITTAQDGVVYEKNILKKYQDCIPDINGKNGPISTQSMLVSVVDDNTLSLSSEFMSLDRNLNAEITNQLEFIDKPNSLNSSASKTVYELSNIDACRCNDSELVYKQLESSSVIGQTCFTSEEDVRLTCSNSSCNSIVADCCVPEFDIDFNQFVGSPELSMKGQSLLLCHEANKKEKCETGRRKVLSFEVAKKQTAPVSSQQKMSFDTATKFYHRFDKYFEESLQSVPVLSSEIDEAKVDMNISTDGVEESFVNSENLDKFTPKNFSLSQPQLSCEKIRNLNLSHFHNKEDNGLDDSITFSPLRSSQLSEDAQSLMNIMTKPIVPHLPYNCNSDDIAKDSVSDQKVPSPFHDYCTPTNDELLLLQTCANLSNISNTTSSTVNTYIERNADETRIARRRTPFLFHSNNVSKSPTFKLKQNNILNPENLPITGSIQLSDITNCNSESALSDSIVETWVTKTETETTCQKERRLNDQEKPRVALKEHILNHSIHDTGDKFTAPLDKSQTTSVEISAVKDNSELDKLMPRFDEERFHGTFDKALLPNHDSFTTRTTVNFTRDHPVSNSFTKKNKNNFKSSLISGTSSEYGPFCDMNDTEASNFAKLTSKAPASCFDAHISKQGIRRISDTDSILKVGGVCSDVAESSLVTFGRSPCNTHPNIAFYQQNISRLKQQTYEDYSFHPNLTPSKNSYGKLIKHVNGKLYGDSPPSVHTQSKSRWSLYTDDGADAKKHNCAPFNNFFDASKLSDIESQLNYKNPACLTGESAKDYCFTNCFDCLQPVDCLSTELLANSSSSFHANIFNVRNMASDVSSGRAGNSKSPLFSDDFETSFDIDDTFYRYQHQQTQIPEKDLMRFEELKDENDSKWGKYENEDQYVPRMKRLRRRWMESIVKVEKCKKNTPDSILYSSPAFAPAPSECSLLKTPGLPPNVCDKSTTRWLQDSFYG